MSPLAVFGLLFGIGVTFCGIVAVCAFLACPGVTPLQRRQDRRDLRLAAAILLAGVGLIVGVVV